jgi:SAM-dependent methyltransferase
LEVVLVAGQVDPEVAERFSADFWNERYSSQTKLWSGNPNKYLVSEVSGLSPGAALDVGCGEGADAIWLAQQGWQVTGVDISTVALDRARAHAAGAGPEMAGRIGWQQADIFAWAPEADRYDLVSAQYMHPPSAVRERLFPALGSAVRPGGSLLIVAHHPSDLQTTIPRPNLPDLFFTGDELAALLGPGGWDTVTNTAPGRTAQDPEGRTVTIHDTVFRAVRRG